MWRGPTAVSTEFGPTIGRSGDSPVSEGACSGLAVNSDWTWSGWLVTTRARRASMRAHPEHVAELAPGAEDELDLRWLKRSGLDRARPRDRGREAHRRPVVGRGAGGRRRRGGLGERGGRRRRGLGALGGGGLGHGDLQWSGRGGTRRASLLNHVQPGAGRCVRSVTDAPRGAWRHPRRSSAARAATVTRSVSRWRSQATRSSAVRRSRRNCSGLGLRGRAVAAGQHEGPARRLASRGCS